MVSLVTDVYQRSARFTDPALGFPRGSRVHSVSLNVKLEGVHSWVEKMAGERNMSSCLVKELRSLPVIQALEEMYVSSKKSSSVLSTGLAVLEYSLGSLSQRFYSHSSLAARMDNLAGEGVSRLVEKYPSLHQSPKEIKDRTYGKVRTTVRTTVRRAMKTLPGRAIVGGLDWMIDSGEGLLVKVTPCSKSPSADKSTGGAFKKKQTIHKEHAYASEDSGACDAETETKRAHKSQQTTHPGDEAGLLMKAYMTGVVTPVDKLVKSLKVFRRYVAGKRWKSRLRGGVMTPEKEQEIKSRRKVSPKKKVTSTFLGRIRQRTLGLLGYRPVKAIQLGSGKDGGTSGDADKKRKHEEILTDDASDSDEDLENFDYDNYDSEDDPDYEPTDSEATDDTLTEDSEPESDLEAEIVESGKPLVQLKRKGSPKHDQDERAPRMEGPEKPAAEEPAPHSRPEGEVEV